MSFSKDAMFYHENKKDELINNDNNTEAFLHSMTFIKFHDDDMLQVFELYRCESTSWIYIRLPGQHAVPVEGCPGTCCPSRGRRGNYHMFRYGMCYFGMPSSRQKINLDSSILAKQIGLPFSSKIVKMRL